MSDVPSVWLRSGEQRPGPKPAYSLEQVADACMSIADAEGLEALAMRRVADELGTSAGALYRYVRGKRDLYALMADAAIATITYPRASGDLRADVHALAEVTRQVHRAHPWLAIMPRAEPGPRALEYLDRLVGILAPAVPAGTSPMLGAAMISGWITMFSAQQAAAGSAVDSSGGAGHIAAMLTSGDYPHLRSAFASAGSPIGDDEAFAAGIDALLFGIVGDASA